MAAAYALDPINFKKPSRGDHARPPIDAMSAEQQADFINTVARMNLASGYTEGEEAATREKVTVELTD